MGLIFVLLISVYPILPNPSLTPGDYTLIPLQKLCTPGYSTTVRNVSWSLKRAVFKEYGIDSTLDHFEIDHLVSLELGGTNSIKNLWPQSYTTTPYNAHIKDKLENRLHYMVCHGSLDLATAQKDISTDWIATFKKYITNGSEKVK